MAAITLTGQGTDVRRLELLHSMGNLPFQVGIGQFSTTDATGTITVMGIKDLRGVFLIPLGTLNTDETLYVSSTEVNGSIVMTNTNGVRTITIGRTGTCTSGLKFIVLLIGLN